MATTQPTLAEIRAYAQEYAKKKGLDPDYALAIMDMESSGNPSAISKRGAKGVYQLFPAAIKDVGGDPSKAMDWKANTTYGIDYLSQKVKEAGGDYILAAGYFNQGKNGFDRMLKNNSLNDEVTKYVNNPKLSKWAKDSQLTQIANPTKNLKATQENANTFDRGALYRDNIENMPTQADITAQQANPITPVNERDTLADSVNQLRLDSAREWEERRKKKQQEDNDARYDKKVRSINEAATFLVSSFLGNKGDNSSSESGVGAGKSVGAKFGNQTQAVLSQLQGRFTPNAFNNFSLGGK
ncbi:transglycosylase SLT domain-containing protein [Escherichia coli]